ncbi:uncharacterized protein ACLA_075500 [Aspergillus clavatus NRRL 1]|uniref:Uncharacterized protein n=1 Tax=Aspergillus clavatus (strain ATCC 1007 / CBS 513.65 / DSM 816 / NCTC 3887 / NRRL 1 / QM 1276 / 107) TaxID=344612 RepID=A1C7Z0_ASPCL|nr:uncharacterized protein ACLA_075500 [Aspergillus clavatus NRRL 1]EAW14511.1 conserved hypothetical protein [Aspergillus clavatus NRRL 1]
MPSSDYQPPRNPTVEECSDEQGDKPQSQNLNAQRRLSSWPEICSQHESVLSSHLDMLNGVKNQVAGNGDAFRLISSMVEKTNKLVTQFQVIKKQLMNRPASFGGVPDQGARTEMPGNSDSSRRNNSTEGKKRLRMDEDAVQADIDVRPGEEQGDVEPTRSQKRKRREMVIAGSEIDVRDVMPVSMETEDISEEVQRRLKIKEERRKKRDARAEKGDAKPEKRKRDSLASNGSASSAGGASRPRRKKTKTDAVDVGSATNSSSQADGSKPAERKRGSEVFVDNQSTSGTKRQRKAS